MKKYQEKYLIKLIWYDMNRNKIYFIYGAVCGLICFLFNDLVYKNIIIEQFDVKFIKFKIRNNIKKRKKGKV